MNAPETLEEAADFFDILASDQRAVASRPGYLKPMQKKEARTRAETWDDAAKILREKAEEWRKTYE